MPQTLRPMAARADDERSGSSAALPRAHPGRIRREREFPLVEFPYGIGPVRGLHRLREPVCRGRRARLERCCRWLFAGLVCGSRAAGTQWTCAASARRRREKLARIGWPARARGASEAWLDFGVGTAAAYICVFHMIGPRRTLRPVTVRSGGALEIVSSGETERSSEYAKMNAGIALFDRAAAATRERKAETLFRTI